MNLKVLFAIVVLYLVGYHLTHAATADGACAEEGTCADRPKWCPEPWPLNQCLESSGKLAPGPQVPYQEDLIKWETGLSGHTHYKVDASKTAIFVIDPQLVYAACPKEVAVDTLMAGPSTKDFDGHSPLCCEKFYDAVANINKIAAAARAKGIPVFVIGHVYRDTTGDGKPDNCGRLCDFDVAGWSGWPMAYNLWNEAFPWSQLVYKSDSEPQGFAVDYDRDFYAEKSVYSAMTAPVVDKLNSLGIDTLVVTGFMTQFCVTTTARHAHDLGYRVIIPTDTIDGPILQELVSGIDENAAIGLYLGTAVGDTTSTEELVGRLQ